ncbi:MAG: ATP-binding protein [Sandaracinus sp.]
MEPPLNRDHILAVLYDMAMVIGGEVRVRPLVTRTVQRLLYHTSFPVGLLLLDPQPRNDGMVEAALEVAIGDFGLTSRAGESLVLPAALVLGPASEVLDRDAVDALPVQPRSRGTCVRLPVGDVGVILLVAPELPHAEVPVAQVFQPVMANLARAIVLCRSYEAQERELVAERDEARLGLRRFRAAVDTAPDLVFIVDPHTQHFVDVNDSVEVALATPRAQLLERGLADYVVELDASQLGELYEALRPRGVATREATLRIARGQTMPVEIRFSALEPPGEPPLVIAAARDLTERRKMETQLQQAQKLDAIGRLAGGVAHDFNNLLTVILGGASSLLEILPATSPEAEELREIEHAAERAAALTRQLLIFSRKGPALPKLVDLDECVSGMVRMLKRLIGEPIELVTRSPAAPTYAMVDASQLEQVIMNLAVNARDAMPNGGRLTIEVLELAVDPEMAGSGALTPHGPYAVVAVSDTGTGMPEDVRLHLFEPFFTTKEPGRGTGLGLSTVYGIVQQAGGHLRVTSAPGRGSRFEVWLPRAEQSTALDVPSVRPRSPRGGNELVLLVEDEGAVRELAARTLRRAGYEVIEAGDGVEALAIAERTRSRIDVLVSDAVMPRMGGAQLAKQLRGLWPSIPVLFVSGYAREPLADPSLVGARFLAKPYTGEALLGAVRELLDAART